MSDITATEFSRILEVERLPKNGLNMSELASADECVALAERYKIEGVSAFNLKADVTAWRKKGLHVKATVMATITQICVISLDAFDQDITEAFDVVMLPDSMLKPSDDEEDGDQPEAIIDGKADIGELAVQYLALAIDLYPRKTSDSFGYIEDDGVNDNLAKESPFAALEGLKEKSD